MNAAAEIREFAFGLLQLGVPFALLFGLAYGIYAFIRMSRRIDAVFPDTVAKYGLSWTREKEGQLLSNIYDCSELRGTVKGIPVEIVSTYQTRGRMRKRATMIGTPAPAYLPSGAINVNRYRPRALVHLLKTGDAHFDARRYVTSDTPELAHALLTDKVRACLLRCPQTEIQLAVGTGQLVLSYPDTPSSTEELHAAVDALLSFDRSGIPSAPIRQELSDEERNETSPSGFEEASVARAAPGRQDANQGLPSKYSEQLGRSSGFTAEQLDANRAGVIYPVQYSSGTRGATWSFVFWLALALATLGGGLGGAYMFYEDLGPRPSSIDLNGVSAIVAGAVLVSASFFYLASLKFSLRRERSEAFQRGPQLLEGPIEKQFIDGRGVPSVYKVRVAGRTLYTSRTTWELLTQGARYRVYVAADQVLSIEPVRNPNSAPSAPLEPVSPGVDDPERGAYEQELEHFERTRHVKPSRLVE